MISAFFRTAKIIKTLHVLFMYISVQATCLTRNISISGFHRASLLLSVTFINQLMHSIITVVDVKIYVI